MQRFNDLSGRSSQAGSRRRQGLRQSLELTCLILLLTVTLATFICAITASAVSQTASLVAIRPNVTRTSLPTFTPTSLPTLTPTTSSIEVSGTPSPSPPVNAPVSTSPPALIAVQSNTSTGEPTRTAFAPAGTPPPPAAVASPAPISVPPNSDGPAVASSAARWPTFTPTSIPVPMTPTPTVAAPDFTSTPALASADWSFAGVRVEPGQSDNSMMLYGNLINNTETARVLEFVTGTFYDAQGQVIAGDDSTYAYWPGYAVAPNGGTMPFELLVDGIDNAADFDLSLEGEASSTIPRQDFEISNLEQWIEVDDYCVAGTLGNPGNELQEYLIITVVLYDDQENVVNFYDKQAPYPMQLIGDRTYDFKVCIGPPNQKVAHFELQVWGL